MKKSQKALNILAKIRDLLESEQFGFDNPEILNRFTGLVQILKMHTSDFLPNNTFRIYLGEQVGKLNEYKNYLCSGQRPRFWQTHEECRTDMVTRCIIAQGLIERHAEENEENARKPV